MIAGLTRIHTRLLGFEGSTRSVGLMRIGLALLMWTAYGSSWRLFQHETSLDLVVLVSFWCSSTLMLLGVSSQLSTAAAGLTQAVLYHYYGIHLDIEAYHHHHTYTLMVGTLLLSMTPCGRSFSFDRWLDLRRADRDGRAPLPEFGPLWALLLIGLQVSCIYFWGAYNKSHLSWFNGARMTHFTMKFYLGSELPSGTWFLALMTISGAGTVLLEYLLAFGLWVRRWQIWLIPAGLALHAAMYVTLPVSTFSATMWLLYLSFVDPELVHRGVDRMVGAQPRSG